MTYDSEPETLEHIETVRDLLREVYRDIGLRAANHDNSKLHPPEKEMFDEFTPKLRAMTYGSDEYKQALADMGPALEHHYQFNDHHPEHHANGVHGMNLVQLVEMLCDWKAATMRHDDGDLRRSLEQNRQRFGYTTEIHNILVKTAEDFGWI